MHPTTWNPPAPLWASVLEGDRRRFDRPEILRFAVDEFMEELGESLASDPGELDDLVVRPETWRTAPNWEETGPAGLTEEVKLYQPVHQRFYLVTASLVCRVRGLPDRRVRPAEGERAAFVLRRVAERPDETFDVSDPDTFSEFGWCGPEDGWQPVEAIDSSRTEREKARIRGETPPSEGPVEETLPLFPVTFPAKGALETSEERSATNGSPGGTRRRLSRTPRRRTLWAGLIPVARRDEYEMAPGGEPATEDELGGDDFSPDPRIAQAEATIVQALGRLETSATLANPTAEAVEGVRDAFLYALLNLVQFARQHLNDLYDAIRAGSWQGGVSEQEAVWDALDVPVPAGSLHDELGTTWQEVLHAVEEAAEPVQPGLDLLGLDDLDALLTLELDPSESVDEREEVAASIADLGVAALRSNLRAAVEALPDAPDARPPDVPDPVQLLEGSRYVVRCVHDRPGCAPYETRTQSAPSRAFRMASFFDTEAPARPLKVNLPVDTSVGTLRDTAKGVSFLFSQQLRRQVQRVQEVTFGDLDEGEIGSGGGVSIGMICSLSIPIITICALILLLVMVFVLNIVFWWLPYFKICFPIPKPSGD